MDIQVLGSGPPLVLLHGWAMHGGVFAPLLEKLGGHFSLHVVDLPGHGRSRDSDVPLTLAAVAGEVAARTPPSPWLGWSLGGLVAMHAAQCLPHSVRALIAVCASPRFVRADDWAQGMDPAIFLGFSQALSADWRGTVDRFLMLEAHGSDHRREEIRLLREQVFAHGEPSPSVLAQGLALLQDSDLRDGLAKLAMPSLWLAGRRDRLVTPAAMRWAAERSPGGRFHCFEHAAHAPFLTHADAVAEAVLQFHPGLPA